jgi:hypothetical protein
MPGNKIKARIVIEIAGTPKEHVESTLKMVIEKLTTEKEVAVMRQTTYEPVEIGRLWSTFSDIEVEVNDINRLVSLCFDYMPSSVEIIEPNSITSDAKDVTDMVNDLLAKLHNYDMVVKNLNAENTLLKKKQA